MIGSKYVLEGKVKRRPIVSLGNFWSYIVGGHYTHQYLCILCHSNTIRDRIAGVHCDICVEVLCSVEKLMILYM